MRGRTVGICLIRSGGSISSVGGFSYGGFLLLFFFFFSHANGETPTESESMADSGSPAAPPPPPPPPPPRPPPPTTCRHCAGPLSKEMETSKWSLAPLVRDSFSMIGSAVGGTASAFYGFNHAMPVVRRYIKGPMWLHFLVGAPPVIIFSSACAGLAGGAVPALAQLASSSLHAAMSSSSPQNNNTIQKSRTSI